MHGTALEVCKLLLNLDWRDPMGAVFIINYFAIRCHDYTFVKVSNPSARCNDDLRGVLEGLRCGRLVEECSAGLHRAIRPCQSCKQGG